MSEAKKQANLHWGYVKSVLEAHGEHPEIISKIGFHYVAAMIHGHKHGAAGDWCEESEQASTSPEEVAAEIELQVPKSMTVAGWVERVNRLGNSREVCGKALELRSNLAAHEKWLDDKIAEHNQNPPSVFDGILNTEASPPGSDTPNSIDIDWMGKIDPVNDAVNGMIERAASQMNAEHQASKERITATQIADERQKKKGQLRDRMNGSEIDFWADQANRQIEKAVSQLAAEQERAILCICEQAGRSAHDIKDIEYAPGGQILNVVFDGVAPRSQHPAGTRENPLIAPIYERPEIGQIVAVGGVMFRAEPEVTGKTCIGCETGRQCTDMATHAENAGNSATGNSATCNGIIYKKLPACKNPDNKEQEA